MSLKEIEILTRNYSEARNAVGTIVDAVNDEIAVIKKRYLARLKKAVETMADYQSVLKQAIEDNADLFEKPRTRIFHGIKVGIQKGKGEITWVDEAQVVKLIHRHFPDKVEMLIKTTERPVKGALAGLIVSDLKKLGVTVVEDGDAVVIRATDSEIDKLVAALLEDDERIEKAAA